MRTSNVKAKTAKQQSARRNGAKDGLVIRDGLGARDGLAKEDGLGRKAGEATLELRLYVAGQTPKSLIALRNLKKICEEHLRGRYRLHVIDLVKTPQLAQNDQILAIPTLVRNLPQPIRKIIGDLSDTQRVLVGLNIRPDAE